MYGGPDYRLTYPNGDQVAIVSALFACRVLEGEPIADGRELLALRYFPPQAVLDDLAVPARMRERIAQAARGVPGAYFAPATWQPPEGAVY